MDSFFPLLKEIEKEVIAIDDLVFLDFDQVPPIQIENQGKVANSAMSEKVDATQHRLPEKIAQTSSVSPNISLRRVTIPLVFSQCKRTINRIWKSTPTFTASQSSATHFTLRRIARTRKLVTLLARLLATKSEVIAQIRKRLLTSSQSGLGNGTNRDEDVEVSIYLGDVQGVLILVLFSLSSL